MEIEEYRRLCEEGARALQKVLGPRWKCEPIASRADVGDVDHEDDARDSQTALTV